MSNLLNFTKKIKNYFSSCKKNNSNNPQFYLPAFSETIGTLTLNRYRKKKNKLLNFFLVYFKSFFSISFLSDTIIINHNNKNNFKSIFVTWARAENFKSDGSYYDHYINAHSKKNKKVLWFIIDMDGVSPKKIDKNIIIFSRKNCQKFDLIYLLKIFFFNIYFLITLRMSKCSVSYLDHISILIWDKLSIFIHKDIKKVTTPYEAQPFQNFIFYKIKKFSNKIKTCGYIHNNQPYPSHMFKRYGSPEKIMVHSVDQKFHLEQYFGWKKKDIIISSSLRFIKKDSKRFINNILLPYDFDDYKFYLNKFESLVRTNANKFGNLKVKNHPLKISSKKHQLLLSGLSNIIKKNKKKFKSKSKIKNTIILGASSGIFEALENHFSVFHIFEDKILEKCSIKMWPSMKIKQLEENIYKYNLIKINNLINITKKNSDKAFKFLN
jgi:hypothetical protein